MGVSSEEAVSSKSKHKSRKKEDKRGDEKKSSSSSKHRHSTSPSPEPPSKKQKSSSKKESNDSTGGGEKLSLSIEETNKLRASLGLKPLDLSTNGDQPTTTSKKANVYVDKDTAQEFEHKPAKN